MSMSPFSSTSDRVRPGLFKRTYLSISVINIWDLVKESWILTPVSEFIASTVASVLWNHLASGSIPKRPALRSTPPVKLSNKILLTSLSCLRNAMYASCVVCGSIRFRIFWVWILRYTLATRKDSRPSLVIGPPLAIPAMKCPVLENTSAKLWPM